MIFKEYSFRHAFSGGLDSTYVAYKLIKEQPAEIHDLLYINLYGALYAFEKQIAYLQFKLLKELFPETTIRWREVDSALSPLASRVSERVNGPLSQQINTVTTLAVDAVKLASKCIGSIHTCGWHKSDTIESSNEYGDWAEQDYQNMRGIYAGITQYGDFSRPSQLLTPAWDVPKIDMWNALPEELQRLVFCSNAICGEYAKDKKRLIVPADFKVSEYYNKYGIDASALFLIRDYQDSDSDNDVEKATLTRDRITAIPYTERKKNTEEHVKKFLEE